MMGGVVDDVWCCHLKWWGNLRQWKVKWTGDASSGEK
jgi:hypothetical protein